jgi:hypothetical protein
MTRHQHPRRTLLATACTAALIGTAATSLAGVTGHQQARSTNDELRAPGLRIVRHPGIHGFGQVDTWHDVAATSMTINRGEVLLLMRWTGEARCGGIGPCPARILVNGAEAGPTSPDAVFDVVGDPLELRTLERSAGPLPAGAYTVKFQVFTSNGTGIELANWTFTVERVKL